MNAKIVPGEENQSVLKWALFERLPKEMKKKIIFDNENLPNPCPIFKIVCASKLMPEIIFIQKSFIINQKYVNIKKKI